MIKKATARLPFYLLTELINLSPLFVTLYVFSAYLNLIVFEKIKLDLEQA